MTKIYIASFHRASDGSLTKLIYKMKKHNLYTENHKEADYILAIADRIETYDFIMDRFRDNIRIIHYGAGEISQGCHDEVFRHAITLMSEMQLCVNKTALKRVKKLCKSVDKVPNAYVVGNIQYDNLNIDESLIPSSPYNLVLYNPPTLLDSLEIEVDLNRIKNLLNKDNINTIWIEPNGDFKSELIHQYVTHKTLPREQFLGLLKHCNHFITNSSCQYFEAPFVMNKKNIIQIGERNRDRESKYSKMDIPNASENIVNILKDL